MRADALALHTIPGSCVQPIRTAAIDAERPSSMRSTDLSADHRLRGLGGLFRIEGQDQPTTEAWSPTVLPESRCCGRFVAKLAKSNLPIMTSGSNLRLTGGLLGSPEASGGGTSVLAGRRATRLSCPLSLVRIVTVGQAAPT
jgi:hypothetical protein